MLKLCAVPADARSSAPADRDVVYRFDRRRDDRRAAQGTRMAVFSDAAGRHLLTRVELCDASDSGVGFYSPVAVEPGMSVVLDVRWPATGGTLGTVARCERAGAVYRVGIRGAGRRAA